MKTMIIMAKKVITSMYKDLHLIAGIGTGLLVTGTWVYPDACNYDYL